MALLLLGSWHTSGLNLRTHQLRTDCSGRGPGTCVAALQRCSVAAWQVLQVNQLQLLNRSYRCEDDIDRMWPADRQPQVHGLINLIPSRCLKNESFPRACLSSRFFALLNTLPPQKWAYDT
jgi:hypothetical protein